MIQTNLAPRVRVIPALETATTVTGERRQMRVAAYCRVSTDSDEQLTSYVAQKAYYTEKIESHPDWIMAGIFADEGISGTSLKKRTEFQRMIAACKRGRINLILTKSLSRFARNTVDCLDTVRMLKANGIGVMFEKENINTLTESSEFLITLFSGFAQAESESLSQNVLWGKQKKMAEGKGAFPKLLGYRKSEDGTIQIHPEEAETIKFIFRRYLEGASIAVIKDELLQRGDKTKSGTTKWGQQVVQNILKNEKYIGDVLFQKTIITDPITKRAKKNEGERPMYYVENHHEGIIPRDVFAKVQEEMSRRSSKRKTMQNTVTEQGKYTSKYALSELLVCGECGSPYRRVTWSRNGVKRIVWRCTSRLEFGTKFCQHSPTMHEEKLHSLIMEQLHDFAETKKEVIPTLLEHITETIAQPCDDGSQVLKTRIADITAQQEKLLELVLENMDDPILADQLKALVTEKQALQHTMDGLATKKPVSGDQTARVAEMQAWLDAMVLSDEYDDQLVRQVGQRVTVVDGETVTVAFY